MSIEVKVPQLPESVTDATLVAWHKQPGEQVGRDENLVDLETDKVVLEVPAPASGVIKELKVENGATVTAHVAGRIDRNLVRILIGDRVQIELAADRTRGRIVGKIS